MTKTLPRACCRSVAANAASDGDTLVNISDVSTLDIGCFTYKVRELNDYRDEEGCILMGSTDVANNVISIDTSYNEEVVRETLLHELMHALLNDTHVVDEEVEEKLVRVLSPKLMDTCKRNPALVEFLFHREVHTNDKKRKRS
tara:strand:+ start:565 stop:993 length:429 start_codon:yes stop_codon:yes gene_type:complete